MSFEPFSLNEIADLIKDAKRKAVDKKFKHIVYNKLHLSIDESKQAVIIDPNYWDEIKKQSTLELPNQRYTYCLSDIHGDLPMFLATMFRANILAPYKIDADGNRIILEDNIIGYISSKILTNSKKLYDLLHAYEIRFKAKNCNVVILGDLVDGRRSYDAEKRNGSIEDPFLFGDVDDYYGAFELLLHVILYNLRITGKEFNSTVTIITGNHDIMTLFDAHRNLELCKIYVSDASYKYFESSINRGDALIPFYLFDACVFKIMKNSSNDSFGIFSHGSFSYGNGGNIEMPFTDLNLHNLNILYNDVNNLLFDMFVNIHQYKSLAENNNSLATISPENFITSATWSRLFPNNLVRGNLDIDQNSKTSDSGCEQLINSYPGVDFLVMGHSQAKYFAQNQVKKAIDRRDANNYNVDKCNDPNNKNEACIWVGCVSDKKYPKLILVDSSLSRANSIDILLDDNYKVDYHTVPSPSKDIYAQDFLEKHALYLGQRDNLKPYHYYIIRNNMQRQFAEILLIMRNDENVSDEEKGEAEIKNKYYFLRVRTNFYKPIEYYLIDVSEPVIFPKSEIVEPRPEEEKH